MSDNPGSYQLPGRKEVAVLCGMYDYYSLEGCKAHAEMCSPHSEIQAGMEKKLEAAGFVRVAHSKGNYGDYRINYWMRGEGIQFPGEEPVRKKKLLRPRKVKRERV